MNIPFVIIAFSQDVNVYFVDLHFLGCCICFEGNSMKDSSKLCFACWGWFVEKELDILRIMVSRYPGKYKVIFKVFFYIV